MVITKGKAEIAGLFAADGSMQKEHMCFWGNPKADKEYYDKHLTDLFKKEFQIDVNPHLKSSNSVYGFYVCKKEVLNYFQENLGFAPGKKTYTVKIPNVILESNGEIKAAFVRGYFSGDGCLNFDSRRGKAQEILKIIHTYPRVVITSVLESVIQQLSHELKLLGINNFISTHKSRKSNESTNYRVNVYGKSRLKKWAELIGFSNSNHSTRYEIFLKYGFVPPNTNYDERMKILAGKLTPWSFYPKKVHKMTWIK